MLPSKILFLFVRYAPGSAGNFFISILQTSNQVSCWNLTVEGSKGTTSFESNVKTWVANSFQSDLRNHLKHEPHHPYQLDFFSSKHFRGDDLSTDEFFLNISDRHDHALLDNISRNLYTVMRLNKPIVPLFGYGNPVLNIVVDQPAKKWFYRTRYVKLFGNDGHAWISKENHPEFLAAKYKKIVFNNQYQFQLSKFQFLRNFVIGEPSIQPFFNVNDLMRDSSNDHCPQYVVNLSCLFDQDQFLSTVNTLFKDSNLGRPNIELIQWMYQHYYTTNVQPLL